MTDVDRSSRPEVHLSYRAEYDLDRVRAFSDGVFGVAITLVVVTFVLPDHDATDAKLARDLLGEWPHFLSYLAAFAVIGYTWATHHQLFEKFRRIDTAAVWINLVLLMFVVLTPYPMQLLGHYYSLELPYVVFNLDAFIFGSLNYLLVIYATHGDRLVARQLPRSAVLVLRRRMAVFPIALGLATLLAIPFGAWSLSAWLLIPIGRLLLRGHDDLDSSEDVEEDADGPDDTERPVRSRDPGSGRLRGALLSGLVLRAQSASLTRLIGFSDNVYAIAITLLVLQFEVPEPDGPTTNSVLTSELNEQIHPDMIGYAIGFIVIGLFWTIHHRIFLIIERQDAGLRALNLIHLMFIAVMPFATLVLSAYEGFVTSTALYAACAGLASSSLWGLEYYATRHHRLVNPNIPDAELRERLLTSLTAPAGFLLAVPMAFVNTYLAQAMWMLPFIGTRAFRIQRSRREARQAA